MLIDAARFLNVYDIDLIYSWTPREFNNFIKGAQLRETDQWEREAANALFTAKASNSKKKVSIKDLYDANSARKKILAPKNKKETVRHLGRFHAAQKAMRNFRPQNIEKGG
ncbi:hypothetical protein [Planococcus versutus]|uniref:Uncharacterized protein n=1 Tax=Planococcus versutus TaxID=1302659 RepID=A0A1B1S5L8_9BACL|nr:hypothetical protein [Planococcus versutus]ANU28459.1 hypothetical protein I858_015830 [Planococcus versutus]